jgi:hypothetical protein
MVVKFGTDKQDGAGAHVTCVKSAQNNMLRELLAKKNEVGVAAMRFLNSNNSVLVC